MLKNKDFEILHVGHGKKMMSNKYSYSQNFIRPFDKEYSYRRDKDKFRNIFIFK